MERPNCPELALRGRQGRNKMILAMTRYQVIAFVVAAFHTKVFAEAPPAREDRAAFLRWVRQTYEQSPEKWPKPTLDDGVEYRELGTPGPVPAPAENPITEEKAKLGMSLFFDPRLSASRQTSCASCHDPELGWADGRSRALGVFTETLGRNTPGLVGVGHMQSLFWDGRAVTLEEQARAVLLHPKEMAAEPEVVEDRLAAEKEFYAPRFRAAFGDETITFDRVILALATFQRSLADGRTDFDQFLGGRREAMSDEALAGLHLFRTDARCLNCHHGPEFSDHQFHNVGLTYYGRELFDPGRYQQSKTPEDMGKFRTPGLRNVSRTGPWMHNGLFPQLDGVLRMYNAGMPRPKPKPGQETDPKFPVTSPLLKKLDLSRQDLADLEAFLRSLEEPATRVLKPPFPPMRE